MESEITKLQQNNRFNKISFIIFIITIILSPILVLPIGIASLDASKTYIIVMGVLVSSILYVLSTLKGRTISIPKHPIIIVGALIVISTVISAFLSTNITKSLIGQGFEMSTAGFLVIMFIGLFLASRFVLNDRTRLMKIFSAVSFSFIILFILQLVRLLDPSFLSMGVLNTTTATFMGKWSDFGIFAGLIFIIAYFANNLLTVKKNTKIFLYILLSMSTIVLLIVNMSVLWLVLSLVFLVYFLYSSSKKKGVGNGLEKIISKIAYTPLIIFILTSVLFFSGNKILSPIVNTLGLNQAELTLPWQLSLDVTSDTIKYKPLFGAGPNRFLNEFLLHKPLELNQSDYWNLEFNTGYSYLSSFVVAYGVVGSILWIIFFILFSLLGIKALKKVKENSIKFTLLSTFFGGSFLWIISLFYNPAQVIVFFAFIMLGLSLAILGLEGQIKDIEYIGNTNVFSKKAIPVIFVIVLVVLIFSALLYIKKFIATAYFQHGISLMALPEGKGIESAEKSFRNSLKWDKSDIYYQAMSEMNILKVNILIKELQSTAQKDSKEIDKELAKKVNTLIEEAIGFSRSAISIDNTNYYNYISEARVSELAMSLQIPNAYENLNQAYGNAVALNPWNPSIYLNLAKIEESRNKLEESASYINRALQLKPNYTDAIYELGLIYYNAKNYQNAVSVFGKVIELNPQYANARYFLGLSLVRLNKTTEAIEQFENIAKTNPESQEIIQIITNLKSGKAIFNDAKINTPPVIGTTTPTTKKVVPIKTKKTVNIDTTATGTPTIDQ